MIIDKVPGILPISKQFKTIEDLSVNCFWQFLHNQSGFDHMCILGHHAGKTSRHNGASRGKSSVNSIINLQGSEGLSGASTVAPAWFYHSTLTKSRGTVRPRQNALASLTWSDHWLSFAKQFCYPVRQSWVGHLCHVGLYSGDP